MQPAKKKDAPRIARPAVRYWKGKAPKGVVEAGDSDSDIADSQQSAEPTDILIDDVEFGDQNEEQKDVASRQKAQKSMNVALKNVNISKDGKIVVCGKEESGRAIAERASDEESSEEELPKASQVEVSGSSEYETDSEEEDVKPATIFRPVFVPKRARETIAARESETLESEAAIQKREREVEARRKQSHDMVAESIKRELAEKETEEHIPDVDDTDGVDLTAEFEAWRLRELGRIKRDKEEQVKREKEREEIERRRALPEEVRLKEDLERAKKSRDEKPKGKQKFLQKYWHKGAFHQDLEILSRHDYTEATESMVDVSLLPKVMQVRDFGKRSRTKYTHLVDQDTSLGNGGFGGAGPAKPGVGQGCFFCGGPHLKKDCPQFQTQLKTADQTVFASGANGTIPGGERRWSDRDRDGSSPRKDWEEQRDVYRSTGMERFRDNYTPGREPGTGPRGDHYRPHSPSRSRSRSLGRRVRRRRSRSRSIPRDKRRRVD